MIDRRPEWKQASPRAQLVVTLMALEGHHSNMVDGIISPQAVHGENHGTLHLGAGAAPPPAGLHLGRAMMTLDAFLEDRLASGRWPLNAYVKERGFSSLYVRLSQRHILGETRTHVLDIANVEAKKPGAGAFTSLVKRLQLERPELGLFVECVLNVGFRQKLLALGFQHVGHEADLTPSYWLPPLKKS